MNPLTFFQAEGLYNWIDALIKKALQGDPDSGQLVLEIDAELQSRGLPKCDPALDFKF